jgi:hypothetical protein
LKHIAFADLQSGALAEILLRPDASPKSLTKIAGCEPMDIPVGSSVSHVVLHWGNQNIAFQS